MPSRKKLLLSVRQHVIGATHSSSCLMKKEARACGSVTYVLGLSLLQ